MSGTAIFYAFRKYLQYIWKFKKQLFFLGIIFIPAFVTANYLQIYLPKMIVMQLEQKRSIPYLGLSTLLLTLMLMLCIVMREKIRSHVQYGNEQIAQKMQNDYANKLLYIDYSHLEDKKFLAMRNLSKESLFAGGIEESSLQAGLAEFMENLLFFTAASGSVILYMYYLAKLSIWLDVIFIAQYIIGMIVNMKFFRNNEQKYAQQNADTWQKLDYVIRKTEDFSMAKDIRMYRMNGWLTGLVNTHLQKRLSLKKKELAARGLGDIIYSLSLVIYMFAVFRMLLIQFGNGSIGISDVLFYANMSPALYELQDHEVSNRLIKIFHIVTRFGKFQQFMEYGEDTGKMDVPVRKEAPTITLEHVSYTYPEASEAVLQDIHLTITAGENIAIVGVNGAGKTTLMKLICGLLHPTSGRILLNGVDMETMSAEERYAWFSCTFQDIQFLPVSIRENISQKVYDTNADNLSPQQQRDDDEKIWHCLQQAGIRKEIEALSNKLDTMLEKSINENATDFSGGQRQKLILARALYRDAGALILDEPTAALDALAENEIYEKYAEFAKGKTSFFVSHRLSSTRFCDTILLLNGGVIAEWGNHEQLLAQNGIYANMFALQSKYYQENA